MDRGTDRDETDRNQSGARATSLNLSAMGENDPLPAKLLAAATAGAPPAGWAQKHKPVRIVLDPDDRPVAKGNLCSQAHGFNLHAATKVAVPEGVLGSELPPSIRLCTRRLVHGDAAGYSHPLVRSAQG